MKRSGLGPAKNAACMRIVLADSRARVRSALRALLEQQPAFMVLGEAAEARQLLKLAGQGCPDLVLLDWDLPDLAAVDLVPTLRQLCPLLRVIVLSGNPDARPAALAAGVDAFVSKSEPPEQLLASLAAFARPGEASLAAEEQSVTGRCLEGKGKLR